MGVAIGNRVYKRGAGKNPDLFLLTCYILSQKVLLQRVVAYEARLALILNPRHFKKNIRYHSNQRHSILFFQSFESNFLYTRIEYAVQCLSSSWRHISGRPHSQLLVCIPLRCMLQNKSLYFILPNSLNLRLMWKNYGAYLKLAPSRRTFFIIRGFYFYKKKTQYIMPKKTPHPYKTKLFVNSSIVTKEELTNLYTMCHLLYIHPYIHNDRAPKRYHHPYIA